MAEPTRTEVLEQALRIAVESVTSAVTDCSCETCEDERQQMFDWYLNEARERLGAVAHG